MPRRRENSEDATINLTPMIDVVFLLVIFFMVGSKFGEAESQMKVDLPTAGISGAISRMPDQRVVAIAIDGSVALDDVPMPIPQLTETLRVAVTNFPETRVSVRAPSDLSLQQLTSTMHAVKSAGIRQISIATKSLQR